MTVGAETRDGAIRTEPETGPERLCVVTRLELAAEALVRFVAAPDGSIVPDLARKLPGRGVWVSCERAHVATAVKTKAFARSLKRPVTVPADLADSVEALLLRRALAALSMANKAGLVLAGFVKIDAAIAAGEVRALLHAAEAAADGMAKLDRKLAAVAAARGVTPLHFNSFPGHELSLALGRANVVHAALKSGGATGQFTLEAGRLARYRSNEARAAGQSGGPQRDLDTERV